jgi:RNA polymerase sigma-70 factor, ECF subfamily
MQSDPNSELHLAQCITGGEDGALQEFYSAFANPLFAFIHHRMGNQRADAEEVWQDSLLAALRSLPAYRGDSRMFTWMCAIARHKIADHYRRRGISLRREEPAGVLDGEMLEKVLVEDEDLQSARVRSRVIEALESLGEDQRFVLKARYLEERSVSDIAGLLGKSYKAAEALLSRARAAFQTAYGGMPDE